MARPVRTESGTRSGAGDPGPAEPAVPKNDQQPVNGVTHMLGNGASGLGRRLSNTAKYTLVDSTRLRWQKRMVKVLWTSFLLVLMTATVLSGHLYAIVSVLFLECVCFKEIISVSFLHSSVRRYVRSEALVEEKELPLFKSLNWYFFAVANYFAFGMLVTRWLVLRMNGEDAAANAQLLNLAEHHQFVSFSLYTLGLVMFVSSLKYGYYRFQFAQFGWTHMLLLGVVSLAHVLVCNIHEGFIWFVLPICIVATLGSAVRVVSIILRRPAMTAGAPHKVIGGYLLSAIITIIAAFWGARLLSSYQYFVCPSQELTWSFQIGKLTCDEGDLFKLTPYRLPPSLASACAYATSLLWPGNEGGEAGCKEVDLYPMQLHAVALAVASVVIVPWAAYLTQGFKKAFFLTEGMGPTPTLSGYGALSRRVDTQLLMAAFTYVYYETFVLDGSKRSRATDFAMLVDVVFRLSAQRRADLLRLLRQSLESDGIGPDKAAR